MHFHNLLVAVDGSDHAMKALELAIQLEDKFESNLHILSVYRHYGMFESSHSLIRPRQELTGPDEALREIATEIVDMAAKHARGFGCGRHQESNQTRQGGARDPGVRQGQAN